MRLIITVLLLLLISGVAIVGFSRVNQPTYTDVQANLSTTASQRVEINDFSRAYAVQPITFPADLGSHNRFQTEWWYYTGNLADEVGHRYGFQLTFFRRALSGEAQQRTSEWGSNQIYFAHFALTDVANETFYARERWSRGGANLAGAQSDPYRVWLENWQVMATEAGKVHLKASTADITLDLMLESLKPPVLQGDQGLSPKSDTPGNASYYYSFTRQEANGTVTTPAGTAQVSGFAWKDHEWSTSALGPDAQGWDWFSLQLDDNREIMFFQIRNADGSLDPVSDGVIVAADGQTKPLGLETVQIQVLDHWESPQSGAQYPAAWRLTIPAEAIDLTIKPLLPQQELLLSFSYWEGAVRVEGSQTGYGYIEMTGYAGSMQGQF